MLGHCDTVDFLSHCWNPQSTVLRMKFTDLEFKQHPGIPGQEAIQAIHFFPNGYGASVVRFPGSYGYEEGLYELAVLEGTIDDYDLCYDTPITDDIMGHLSEESIEDIINDIQTLTEAQIEHYREWVQEHGR
jgi:hypothetical protein